MSTSGLESVVLSDGSTGLLDPIPKSKVSSFFDSNCFLAATKFVKPVLVVLGCRKVGRDILAGFWIDLTFL